MNNELDPQKQKRNPSSAFLWLILGLLPIPILLSLGPSMQPNRSWTGYMVLFCAFCNLAGGIGCLSGVKDGVMRIVLGVLLAGFFFLLSLGIVLFQACSHMHF